MRTGAPAGYEGYFHECGLYGSDEEFLALAVPFLEGGLAAGEPTTVAVDTHHEQLLREAIVDTSQLSFLVLSNQYSRPAGAIKAFREALAGHVSDGAHQVRMVGQVPHPALGSAWEPWARYEAAINEAFAEFPAWGMCIYDTRIASPAVLDDVARTHPHLATTDGTRRANPRFEDPASFLTRYRPGYVDPLERQEPTVALADPSPDVARRATSAASPASGLPRDEVDALVLAVSECVTNATCHGTRPVEVRVWSAPGRMVATVSDRGSGPADPLSGLVPCRRDRGEGGLGLWITHQVCEQVTMHQHDDGFTVRLVVGTPVTQPAPHLPAYRH
jgi:anti-sigma regulatory factor (Ser/Thr protein kinase)